MKYIQTLYCGQQDPLQSSFGWADRKYHAMSWILSSGQMSSLLGASILYADKRGVDFLYDTLGISYEEIHICDEELDEYHSGLWALPKIYTYRDQKEPFIHIDGDFFVFDRFPSSLEEASVVVQNIEVNAKIYTNYYADVIGRLPDLPDCISREAPPHGIKAYNAGIIGGRDVTFLNNYADSAIEFVRSNHSKMKDDPFPWSHFNIFFEQMYLFELAKNNGKEVVCLFDEKMHDNYGVLYDFCRVPRSSSFLHLLGGGKFNKPSLEMLEMYVKEHYNSQYQKLVKAIESSNFYPYNVQYSTKNKNNKVGVSIEDFIELHFDTVKLVESISNNDLESDYKCYLHDIYSTVITHERNEDCANILGWIQNLSAHHSEWPDAIRFKANPRARVIDTKWNYRKLADKAEYEQVLLQQAAVEPHHEQTLVSSIDCDNGYTEIEVNHFDTALFEVLKVSTSFDTLKTTVVNWFPPTESEDQILAMLVGRIRRYVSANAVKVVTS